MKFTSFLLLAALFSVSFAANTVTIQKISSRKIWASVAVDTAATGLACEAVPTTGASKAATAIDCPSPINTASQKYNCIKDGDKKCIVEFGGLEPNTAYKAKCGAAESAQVTTNALNLIVYPTSNEDQGSGDDNIQVKVWVSSNAPKWDKTRSVACAWGPATVPAAADAATYTALSGDANTLTCTNGAGEFEDIIWTCSKNGISGDDQKTKDIYCMLKEDAAYALSSKLSWKTKPKVVVPTKTKVDGTLSSVVIKTTETMADTLTYTVKWVALGALEEYNAGKPRADCKVYEGDETGTDTAKGKNEIDNGEAANQVVDLKPKTKYTVKCTNKAKSDNTVKADFTTPEVVINIVKVEGWNDAFVLTTSENVNAAVTPKCKILEASATKPADAAAYTALTGTEKTGAGALVFEKAYDAQTAANNKRYFVCVINEKVTNIDQFAATASTESTLRAPPAITEVKIDTADVYADGFYYTVTVSNPKRGEGDTKVYCKAGFDDTTAPTTVTTAESVWTVPATYETPKSSTKNWIAATVKSKGQKYAFGCNLAAGEVKSDSNPALKTGEIPVIAWKSEPAATTGWNTMYSGKVQVTGTLNTNPTVAVEDAYKPSYTTDGTDPTKDSTKMSCGQNPTANVCTATKSSITPNASPTAVTFKTLLRANNDVLTTTVLKSTTATPAPKAALSAVSVTSTGHSKIKVSGTSTVKGTLKCEHDGTTLDATCGGSTACSVDIPMTNAEFSFHDTCSEPVKCWSLDSDSPALPNPKEDALDVKKDAVTLQKSLEWSAAPTATAANIQDTIAKITAKANGPASLACNAITSDKSNGATGVVSSTVAEKDCDSNNDCSISLTGLLPNTDYTAYCWLQELSSGDSIQPFSVADKYTVAIPAAGFTFKTAAGAQFNGDLSSSSKTYSSVDISAKINTDGKKLECIAMPSTQTTNPTEAQWVEKKDEVELRRQVSCPTKDTTCTVSLVYLTPATTYKVYCRPEGVADSTKNIEVKTDAAPAAGTETASYSIVLAFTPDTTVDAFNANAALKGAIQGGIKDLLKLDSTSTVTVSAEGTAGRKFTTLENKLKIKTELGKVKKSDSGTYFTVLKQSQSNGALQTAIQKALTAASQTVTIKTTSTSVVDNQADNNATSGTSTGDESDSASAMPKWMALAAAIFFLYAWM
jgi:hypothetical protein